mgnify:CR=1 FL=1
MGVLNLTPDSFSDGGNFNTTKKGLKHALEMFGLGANIIDIGGESTRPGSKSVDNKIEWKRIEKIIQLIGKKIPISLDTRKSEIMKKGIKYGVKIINDVSGLEYDSETINVLKKTDAREVVVASQINTIIERTKLVLPPNVEIIVTEDRTKYSAELIDEMTGNILIGKNYKS